MVQNEVQAKFLNVFCQVERSWQGPKQHLRGHSNYVETFVSSLNSCQAVHKC